jgi:hypothetical protein
MEIYYALAVLATLALVFAFVVKVENNKKSNSE